MARRDRREVYHRLVTLLMHQLKWQFQEKRRSRSWQLTIAEQRLRLRKELESGTLRNHAHAILAEAYQEAITLAMIETGLERTTFPEHPPASIEDVLKET